MTLSQKIQENILEIENFPIPGVGFKDISTLFLNPALVKECGIALIEFWKDKQVDKILAIDSRGFLFAPQMAIGLDVGMVMVRKKGKLPPETVGISYELEYGSAHIEIKKDVIASGERVIIHDDLLATGGTALATAELVRKLGAEVVGFSFVVELGFLGGRERLKAISSTIHALTTYP